VSKFGKLGLPVDVPKRMEIINPLTGEPLVDKAGNAAFIDLFSSDSNRARAYARNVTQRRLDQSKRVGITAAAIENDEIGMLAELTKGWHLVDFDHEPIGVAFTTQDARELYAQAEMNWLVEQVQAFCGRRANFATPSAKPSSDTPSTSSQVSGS
jgi:hypothetical protein